MRDERRENGAFRTARTGAALLLRLAFFIAALAVILSLGSYARRFGYNVFDETPAEAPPGREIEITVPEGAGAEEIGRILKSRGLVEDVRVFLVKERLSPYHGKLGSGTFSLNTSMTPTEILEALYDESGTDNESGAEAP